MHPDGSVEVEGIGHLPAGYAGAELTIYCPVAVLMDGCPGQWPAVALGGGTGHDPIAYQACGECEDCRKAGLKPLSVAVWDRRNGTTRVASTPERIAFRIAADGGDPAFEAV